MTIIVPGPALAAALSLAARTGARDVTIRAESDLAGPRLRICASDRTSQAGAAAVVSGEYGDLGACAGEPWTATLAAPLAASVAKAIGADRATLSVDEGDRLRVRCPRASWRLLCLPGVAATFGESGSAHALCAAGELARALDATADAAADPKSGRGNITGIRVAAGAGTIACDATDGHRFHRSACHEVGADGCAVVAGRRLDVAGLPLLRRALAGADAADPVVVADCPDEGRLSVRVGAIEVRIPAPSADDFPDAGQILDPRGHEVRCAACDLEAAIAQATTGDRDRPLDIRIEGGTLAMSATDKDLDTAATSVDVDCSATLSTSVGVSARYLRDALDAVAPGGGAVTLRLKGPYDPIYLHPTGLAMPLAIVMPMRV
jgi:hypothetical protein